MTSNFQLERYLRDVKGFIGVYPSNKLPKSPPSGCSLIVNYSKSGESGSHWVAMKNLNTVNTEYFDSYGFEPDAEDLLLGESTSFTKYLKENSIGGKYKVNQLNFQSLTSDVCGEWASWFIRYGMPELFYNGRVVVNPKWTAFIKNNNTVINDRLIKRLVGIR